MAVLGRLLATGALVATGCYEPQLRDCVVSCTSDADCAPGQVCGSDGMCAGPELAGSCVAIVTGTDAGSTDAPHDARPLDAPMVDAPMLVGLKIEIADRGGVTVQNAGSCHYTAPSHTCTFTVPAGIPLLLTAIPDFEYRFDKWETGPCVGQDETCILTPTALLTTNKVKFRGE